MKNKTTMDKKTVAPSSLPNSSGEHNLMDVESISSIEGMEAYQNVMDNRISGVKFVLVVLSSRGMVFDMEALRQKILLSYPDSAVFFQTTLGKPMGSTSPEKVDLLLDFTGPRQRQGWFYSRKLRKMARVAVGRNAGWFRKKIYDRVYDECSSSDEIPTELLQRERFVQKKVLHLAGVAFVQAGETPPDRSKYLALELPSMQRL